MATILRFVRFVMTSTRRATVKFTLIELIIVLALVSLCLGFLGIRSAKAIQEGRIESAAKQLGQKIELVGQASAALGVPLELELSLLDNALHYTLTSRGESIVQPRRIFHRSLPIEGVDSFEWNGSSHVRLTLHFGERWERGVVTLRSKKGGVRHLALTGRLGQPTPSKNWPTLEEVVSGPYPEELAQLPPS